LTERRSVEVSAMKNSGRGMGVGGWVERFKWRAIALVGVVAVSIPGPAWGESGSHPLDEPSGGELQVRVYNYARVPTAPLARAQAIAGGILRRAGIETTWLDCPLTQEEIRQKPACDTSFGAEDLVLKIVPEAMSEPLNLPANSFGRAVFTEEHGGNTAYLFYDRVKSLAASGVCDAGVLLGHAAAHEIGHLLLGTPAHSASGIMRARWQPDELAQAARGRLTFSAAQAARMRAELHARKHHAEVVKKDPFTTTAR
jgi:hypothetical protein